MTPVTVRPPAVITSAIALGSTESHSSTIASRVSPSAASRSQLGDQVLAQGAARAVVDEGGLTGGEDAGASLIVRTTVPAYGRCEVVVEYDAAGDVGEQPGDGRPAGVGVQPADDRDGEARAPERAGQPGRQAVARSPVRRPSCFPYRRSKRSTRPAVSRTRAVPV
jgi:hypothetical protein